MNKAELAAQLASGVSIEAIARAAGRDPSTVAYWVNKYGLASQFATKHAARGGIPLERLEELVAAGYTVEQMAQEVGRGSTTVRYWLKKHGLSTVRAMLTSLEERPPVVIRRCRAQGFTEHVLTLGGKRYRCRRCRVEAVSARRRRVKRILVQEAGGACRICGYDRYPGALQFHHLNPTEKSFALADQGLARSLESARDEARKCVLVCANCHAELEAGIASMP